MQQINGQFVIVPVAIILCGKETFRSAELREGKDYAANKRSERQRSCNEKSTRQRKGEDGSESVEILL